MKKPDKSLLFSWLSVILGILLGLVTIAGMVWADFESSLFPYGLVGERTAKPLKCPVFMTTSETREISLTLKNPEEIKRSRFAEGTIIEGDLSQIRIENHKVTIEPGGKEKISWKIYPEDVVYGRLVLFRVYVKHAHPFPSLEETCGVLVFDIPSLTGKQMMGILLGLMLALMIGGNAVLLFKYRKELVFQYHEDTLGSRRKYISQTILALTIIVLLGFLISFTGNWIFGFILLLVSIAILLNLLERSLTLFLLEFRQS